MESSVVNISTNWQAIAAIASFLAALAALLTAWLIYRVRPLAVRAIELHSLKFQQELLPTWKSQIPSCPNIFKYDIDEHVFSNTLDVVENSTLFQDLANHIPPGNSLLVLWQNYRKGWDALEKSRSMYACKVRDFINQAAMRIGLSVGSDKDTNVIIEYHFVDRYYNSMLEFCEDRLGPYEGLRNHASNLGVTGDNPPYRVEYSGSTWVFADDRVRAEQARKLFLELVDDLRAAKLAGEAMSLVEEAKKLCNNADKLENVRNQLQFAIDSLIALPLLPNPHCPLLQIAKEPLLPRWLTKLVAWFSPRQTITKADNSSPSSPLLNPLSLGILLFVFCLTLWGQGLSDLTRTIMGAVALAISVVLGIAVLCKPLRQWLYASQRWVYVFVLPLAVVGYLFAYLYTWLSTMQALGGIPFNAVFAVGFFWIFILVMAEASQLSRKSRWLGIAFSLVFFALAVKLFFALEWLAGAALLAYGLAILLRVIFERWAIWDKLPFW